MPKKPKNKRKHLMGGRADAVSEKVWGIMRRIAFEYCQKYPKGGVPTNAVADDALIELDASKKNPETYWLSQLGARDIAMRCLNHYFGKPELVGKEIKSTTNDSDQSELFSASKQDRYSIVRSGVQAFWPRLEMTNDEYLAIIKKLRMIGSTYYSHADELEAERQQRFPVAVNS